MGQDPRQYDPNIRDELTEQDWEEAIAIATKHAVAQRKLYLWLGFEVEPAELVEESIARAFGCGSGAAGAPTYRNWNRDVYPDLGVFLNGIIDSIISQKVKHYRKFPLSPLDESTENQSSAASFAPDSDALLNPIQLTTPEDLALLAERISTIRTALDELAAQDEEAGMVVLAIEDCGPKAADIAMTTGYDVKQVYNITKRIRRKLRDIIQKMNGEDFLEVGK